MKFILNECLGYDLTIIVDSTQVETGVTHTEWNRDSDGKVTSVKFREPNDEVTNQAVSLLEDIAYYRHNNIESTDNLIIELMRKRSETDVINLLRILNKEFGEEQD